jgi:hypothetical protein
MLPGGQFLEANFAHGRELMLGTDDRRMTTLARRQIALLGGAVLAAILAVAIGAGERAGAVVPGTNGMIAFTTDRDGNYDVYVMDADGSTPDPAGLPTGPGSPSRPIATATTRSM